jgi:transposase-like protein
MFRQMGAALATADCRIRSRSMAIRPLIARPKRLSANIQRETSKYLNNLIEQDHRSIKLRLGPMLGFKKFRRAATTIAGIELMHRIRKGQFKLGKLRVKNKTASEIWNAVLAA